MEWLKIKLNTKLDSLKEWFHKLVLKGENFYIESSAFLYAGIWGGAIAGLLIGIFIIIFRNLSGFQDLHIDNLIKLYPLIILFCTIGGGIAAWLCCQYAISMNRVNSIIKNKRLRELLIFIFGFILLVIIHQLPARDALVKIGSYQYGDRMGGGPFGEPDFETLATGLLGGVSLLTLAKGFVSKKIFDIKAGFTIVLQVTIIGVILWCFIYFIYYVLTSFGIIEVNYIPWQSSAIFIIAFPHPERVFLFIVITLVFVSIVIVSVSSKWIKQIENLPKEKQISLRFIGKLDNKFNVELAIPNIYDEFQRIPIRDHCHELLLKFAIKRKHDDEVGGWLKNNEFHGYYIYLSRIAEDLKIDSMIIFENNRGKYRLRIPADNIEIDYKNLSTYPNLKEILKSDWLKG